MKKLEEERQKTAQLEKELEKTRLVHNINNERRFRAEENQTKAEKERKDIEQWLAKAVEDQTWVEDVLIVARDRANKVSQDLLTL